MKAVPKLLRLLSRSGALAAPPPPPNHAPPLRRLLGPVATTLPSPPALPACHPLPCGPAALLPASASPPHPGHIIRYWGPAASKPASPSSLVNLVGEAAPPPPTTAPSLRPRDYLKCGDVGDSCFMPRPRPMASSAPPLHRRLPCAGLALSLTRFPGLGFSTPRTITPWRYPGSWSFSTDATAPGQATGAAAADGTGGAADDKGTGTAAGDGGNGDRPADEIPRPAESEEGQKFEKAVDYFRKHNILVQVPDLTTGSDYNLITPDPDQPFMLHEAAKRSFRTLLKRLDSMHIENKCISSEIVKDNIEATGKGVLLFSEVQTETLTEERVNQNYADIRSCIIDIMTELYGEELFTLNRKPRGFGHLLDAMKDDSLEKSYLLPNHSSLLPVGTRAIAVLKIYMFLLEEMPKFSATHSTIARTILNTAAQPYMIQGHDWYDMAKNDAMLSKWLNYRGGRLYTRTDKSLLELHRHVTHHCMEHIKKGPSGDCTYEAVQNLLEHKFGEFIPRCQFGLWDEKLLKPLRLHSLFTSSPEPYDD